MSRNQRFALVAIAVCVAAAAFAIVKPGENDDQSTTGARTARTGDRPSRGEGRRSGTRIQIRDGKPVGGVHRITVEKGHSVRLTVSSADTASEVHVHGYDLMEGMERGRPASFSFHADIEGVFEVELEDTKTQIAALRVEPS